MQEVSYLWLQFCYQCSTGRSRINTITFDFQIIIYNYIILGEFQISLQFIVNFIVKVTMN